MECRKLPHGNEMIGTLGVGTGGLEGNSEEELEAIFRKAIDSGINFFDLCCGAKKIFRPFGKAISGRRDKVYVQVHFGAVYDKNGQYGWSRDLAEIKDTFEWILTQLGTDYVDFGYLHCVDETEDYESMKEKGIVDYLASLKEKGIVHHIGFSSHTPKVANQILDSGLVDMFMFSINPAYDFDESSHDMGLSMGNAGERMQLFMRAEREGVGISVMKPFYAGKLLDADSSPFKVALSKFQCLAYALDRPGVLTAVPGIRNMEDLERILPFVRASSEERDYSAIGSFSGEMAHGTCVYCHHCQPCPMGIDIGLANKYYDLALAGDLLAISHYSKLSHKADECLHCGHCDTRCPFGVKQSERMEEIDAFFSRKGNE